MPKQKVPKGPAGKDAGSQDYQITDPRFTSFTTDPRFRLPSKKDTRTKVDKRFSRMFKDEEFTHTAKVDRYGRRLESDTRKKALERLYEPEEDDDDEQEEDESEEEDDIEIENDEVVASELKKVNARFASSGEATTYSSEEDESEEDEAEIEQTEGEEVGAFPDMQGDQESVPMGEVTNRIAVVNLDWDNIRAIDLMAVFSSFVPAGGRIEKVSVYKSEFGKERMEREELEGPPREIFSKKVDDEDEDDEDEDDEDEEDEDADEEDLEEEDDELEAEEEDEKIKKSLLRPDAGEEFDPSALRQYQLDRLRYFYAVIIFSNKSTAQHVYEATDGTEYLSSANFIDLRFIPDEVDFDDDKPRDECTSVPAGYKPNEFVTDALQHSKVKLTWDADDASRKEVIKRAFSGSRAEIGENDLKAYLGSDSSEDEEDEDDENQNVAFQNFTTSTTTAPNDPSISASADAPKLSKKELARRKMRAALGLPEDPEPSSNSKSSSSNTKAPVGELQITFTSGFNNNKDGKSKSSVFENEPIREETTAEAYIRKERERKARRREKAKAKREGPDVDDEQDDDDENHNGAERAQSAEVEKEDLGFDDPFFTTAAEEDPSSGKSSQLKKKKLSKEERLRRKLEEEAESKALAQQREELELLMADDSNTATNTGTKQKDKLSHFDMSAILRAEKESKKAASKLKKQKKKGKYLSQQADKGLQSDFSMPVADPRFAAVYESHEFAIDPSNPRFLKTEGMKKVLEEGRERRKRDRDPDVRQEKGAKGDELGKLVESVKKKIKR